MALVLGTVAAVPPAVAAQESAAQVCSAHHKFGAQPVDVAKTIDGQQVLAQVSWGHHPSIGCYLVLNDEAVAALRAAGPPPSLPQGQTDASRTCSAHHKFGAEPVDVAKTADGQAVLARLSWGHHPNIGCYLVLNDTATTTLRTPPDTQTTPTYTAVAAGNLHSCAIRADQTIACWGDNAGGQTDAPAGKYADIAAAASYSCAIRIDQVIACWGDLNDGQSGTLTGQYTAIAAEGAIYMCAVKTDQTTTCWGHDVPEGIFSAIAYSALDIPYGCAVRTDQTITCWFVSFSHDGLIEGPAGKYADIAVYSDPTGLGVQACALAVDGTLVCWGMWDMRTV